MKTSNTNQSYFLGIDLGTTNIKAIVTDNDGKTVADGSAPVEIFYLDNGGVEQEIEQIWQATLSAIKEAVQHGIGAKIKSIGISSQGGAVQIQDINGNPQGRVISWLDGRGKPFDIKLTNELGRDWFASHTGHGMSAMTPGQIFRLREEQKLPEDFKVGFVGDMIVERLCGKAAHDGTSLSLAMFYNPSLKRADPDLLNKTGLSEEILPKLIPANEIAGNLLDEIAMETALPAGIPVSSAVHDQYTAALACGTVNPGDVMFGAGTAWVLLAVTDKLAGPVVDSAFECTHVVEGLYGQILSLGNGGSALSWTLKTLGLENIDSSELDDLVENTIAGCNGLMFFPFLVEGCGAELPAEISGKLTGLRLSHTQSHIIRAVLEGLACELKRHLNLLTDAGLEISRLVMVGHAAGSSVTPQIIANVTGLPVFCTIEQAGSALGATIIARSLVDTEHDLATLSQRLMTTNRSVEPGEEHLIYQKIFQNYMKNLFS